MIETGFALLVVVVCVLLLVRQFIGARRRHALDAALQRMTSPVRRRWYAWRAGAPARDTDRSSRQATRLADDAIRKARDTAARKRDVVRDGNVYTPKSFADPRERRRDGKPGAKRDTLH